MQQDRFKMISYKVSGENTLLDAQNHITPEVRRIIEEIHPDVVKGRKYLIRKLNKLCRQYPRVPVFKNLLSTLYQHHNDMEQAYAVNHWIVKEHPGYLFGKLNLASELLLKDEPEKIPTILGEAMEIGQLYPERKEFHLEEVIGFHLISVDYFLAVDKIEAAESRVEMMEELDPEHFKTRLAGQHLQQWYLAKAAARKREEEKLKKRVVLKDERSQLQTEQPPEFNFPKEIGWLYEHDMSIETEKIEQLLQLDPTKLIEDLEKVLQVSIARFDYFTDREADLRELDFPIHALLLLAELKNESSLPSILRLLKQDFYFIDFWFSDLIGDLMDNALYHCGKEQTQMLFEFLKLPNVIGMNKCAVGESLVKILQERPGEREVFVEHYREVLSTYIENARDENYADTEAVGNLIADLMDLAYHELLPEIEQLFELQLVESGVCGKYEEVKAEILGNPTIKNSEFIKKSLFEKYEELKSYETEETEWPEEDEFIRNLYQREMLEPALFDDVPEPVIREEKTGRNDPCPCGSGKKYKKCCLNT